MSNRPAYAGIGSRETPGPILSEMTKVARHLERSGYLLRSGGARGADTAFELGVTNMYNKQIYVAERNSVYTSNVFDELPIEIQRKTHKLVKSIYPAVTKRTEFVQKLHCRNAMILLGQNLESPVDFVVCWTEMSQEIGGTGVAVKIAREFDIPIINMFQYYTAHKVFEAIRNLNITANYIQEDYNSNLGGLSG